MLTVRGTYREKIYLAIFEASPNANFTSVPDLGFGNFLLVVSVLASSTSIYISKHMHSRTISLLIDIFIAVDFFEVKRKVKPHTAHQVAKYSNF